MLDEGFNPYDSGADGGITQYARRARSVAVAAVPNLAADTASSIKAPTTPAAIRDFDFAAAMFADDNAWRELARTIASDAA